MIWFFGGFALGIIATVAAAMLYVGVVDALQAPVEDEWS